MSEYAVYKGESLLAVGTAEECAEEMGVTLGYIRWLATPSAKKRRKNHDRCILAYRLEDDDE